MNPKHDLVALKIAGRELGGRNGSQPEATRSTGLVLCLAWQHAVRKTGRTNDLPSGGFDRVWRSLALKISFCLNYGTITKVREITINTMIIMAKELRLLSI
jgi:hypothetical protein